MLIIMPPRTVRTTASKTMCVNCPKKVAIVGTDKCALCNKKTPTRQRTATPPAAKRSHESDDEDDIVPRPVSVERFVVEGGVVTGYRDGSKVRKMFSVEEIQFALDNGLSFTKKSATPKPSSKATLKPTSKTPPSMIPESSEDSESADDGEESGISFYATSEEETDFDDSEPDESDETEESEESEEE